MAHENSASCDRAWPGSPDVRGVVMMVGLALGVEPGLGLERGLGAMGGGRGLDNRKLDLGRQGGESDPSSALSPLFSPVDASS